MHEAQLTLIGLYNYDHAVFDELSLVHRSVRNAQREDEINKLIRIFL